ncbi:MAG: uracil-DNA glycosylase family protein [Pseudomonadota bacterium]
MQIHPAARILIAGHAPGRRVHNSGRPFADSSGDRLRDWLGIDAATFYNAQSVAIVPMSFCYPGTGESGDLPPLKRCAPTWRKAVLAQLNDVRLTVVLGQYAQRWHVPAAPRAVTAAAKAWRGGPADTFVLPHPSPRNNPWLAKNPWFGVDVLPTLQAAVRAALV